MSEYGTGKQAALQEQRNTVGFTWVKLTGCMHCKFAYISGSQFVFSFCKGKNIILPYVPIIIIFA